MRKHEQYSIHMVACQAPSLPATTVAKPECEEIPARPQAMEQPTTYRRHIPIASRLRGAVRTEER